TKIRLHHHCAAVVALQSRSPAVIDGGIAIHTVLPATQDQLTGDMGSHIKVTVKRPIPGCTPRTVGPGQRVLLRVVEILWPHHGAIYQVKLRVVDAAVAHPVITGSLKTFHRNAVPQLVAHETLRAGNMLLV